MLLRFGVSNHRSIRDYQELYLSASKRIKRKGLVIPVPTLRENAVPVVALYGGNASGKSNLIDAIDEFRRKIIQSHKRLDATDDIPWDPFRLDDTGSKEPTRFDCTFMIRDGKSVKPDPHTNESVYEYGFEYVATEFRREWLYQVVRKERQSMQLLFYRMTENGQVRVDFGSKLRGKNKTIANLTRPNSLFLSAGAQNNHPLLTDLHRFFATHWTVILHVRVMEDAIVAKRLANYEHMKCLLSLVRQADIGIVDIDVADEEIRENDNGLTHDLAEFISENLSRDDDEGQFGRTSLIDETLRRQQLELRRQRLELRRQRLELRRRRRLNFTHLGEENRTSAFGYSKESKGTKTLISLLIPALEALAQGSVLVIDELDTSLHPSLAHAFVSLFVNKESNPHGAQLIFSTHDPVLIGSGLLHHDEIWMTDKSEEGKTQFTPLLEFNLRSRDDIEKAYRLGRLGGVPSSDSFYVNFLDDPDSAVS